MDLPIPPVEKALLVSLGPDKTEIKVDFNPASLVYTVENSSKQMAGKPKKQQFAARFSGKLSMDLQFDTTDAGTDVRLTTNLVAKFMESSANASRDKSGAPAQAQPVLRFQWGAYMFDGTMESFKETIDFFSAEGVPLRALVSIALVRLDHAFDDATSATSDVFGSLVPTGAGDSVTDITTRAGDPDASRQLGTDNGLDSLRFTGGAALQVMPAAQIGPPSGLANFTAPGTGGSLNVTAGAGGGALFGGQASAGVPASAGAFAGLESGRATPSSTARLDPRRIVRTAAGVNISTGANSTFNPGGASTALTGFSTSVGATFNFNDQFVFDGD